MLGWVGVGRRERGRGEGGWSDESERIRVRNRTIIPLLHFITFEKLEFLHVCTGARVLALLQATLLLC